MPSNPQLSTALSQGFDGLVAFLQDRDGATLSPKRFGEVLNIDTQTLANQARVHYSTITRAPASESLQKFLREALGVMQAASHLCGDVSRAIFWYRNEHLQAFGYKTAEELVSEGRTDDVLRFVGALEVGAAG